MSKELQDILIQHREEGNLVSLLTEAQVEPGYLTPELISEIAREYDIAVGKVYGVASFYSFLSTRPLGRNVIRICQSVPCYLKNSEVIVETVQKALGIGPGQTTGDGKFSLELTNCIGACDQAPAMMVNDQTYVALTPQKVLEILDSLK